MIPDQEESAKPGDYIRWVSPINYGALLGAGVLRVLEDKGETIYQVDGQFNQTDCYDNSFDLIAHSRVTQILRRRP